MKNSTKNIIIVFAIIFFGACRTNKPISKTRKSPENSQLSNKFISGSVNEIQQGKDGYTAKITATNQQVYYVTISRSNLKNPIQYKMVKIGDIIIVKGDLWKMENENHITVREMQ